MLYVITQCCRIYLIHIWGLYTIFDQQIALVFFGREGTTSWQILLTPRAIGKLLERQYSSS